MSLKEILLALNIDRSGSMGLIASDGHSSLEHTIHTTKNIIDYLEELKDENPEIDAGVIVNAFDNKMKPIGYLKIGNKKEKQEYTICRPSHWINLRAIKQKRNEADNNTNLKV